MRPLFYWAVEDAADYGIERKDPDMPHPGINLSCALCGDELACAPTELALMEGYELTLVNVNRTDEDDLEDEDEEFHEGELGEMYMAFCPDCARRAKISIEKWLMRRIEMRNLAGGNNAATGEE